MYENLILPIDWNYKNVFIIKYVIKLKSLIFYIENEREWEREFYLKIITKVIPTYDKGLHTGYHITYTWTDS